MFAMKSTFIVTAMAFILVACGGSGSSVSALPQGSETVRLNPADFVSRIDHPYWPMSPGSKWVFTEPDSRERIEITVTDRKKTILGIEAIVVRDVVTADGELVEDTFDWFAQDKDGNLWYLGEDTTEFENGKPATKAGSWEAGKNGAQAGIFLPADPEVGMRYRQEYLKGEAEDAAEIMSLDELVEIRSRRYKGVLMTKDWTPLQPKILEHKFYAKGVGPVLILGLSGGNAREELTHFTKNPA
jgi:hypothetical protein